MTGVQTCALPIYNNIYSGYQKNEGTVFGTFYHISYEADNDYHNDIKELLKQFDNSLSTFNKKSVISRINLNDDTVVPDLWFNYVFNLSKDINIKTDGAFDITVAPLVNLWVSDMKRLLLSQNRQ